MPVAKPPLFVACTDRACSEHRAASGGGAHAQHHPATNGHASEASQLQYLQRRITAAEADAEGARMELLRACQQAEAAAADVARCKTLEQRLQVTLSAGECLWALRRPCKALSRKTLLQSTYAH